MNSHQYRARDYLEHIAQACQRAESYVSGKSLDQFLAEPMAQDAVIRNLEIIGEASRQLMAVLPDALTRFPAIPFRTMYATRNRMIHGYVTVNMQIVYEVGVTELPIVRKAVQAALANWPTDLT